MPRPTASLRLALIPLIALIAIAAPVAARAQTRADSSRRTLATAMYGDVAVVVNARGDGRVEISAAGDRRSGAAAFSPAALLRWADTTARMVARRVPSSGRGERVLRSSIEEPGLVSGGLSLTRRVSKAGSTYSLFFADSSFGGFSVPLTREDARVFLATTRRAATSVARSTRARAPKRAGQRATGAKERRRAPAAPPRRG